MINKSNFVYKTNFSGNGTMLFSCFWRLTPRSGGGYICILTCTFAIDKGNDIPKSLANVVPDLNPLNFRHGHIEILLSESKRGHK